MPLFGSICGLFTTGETKSLYTVPAFDPRIPVDAIESRRHIRVNAPGGGSSKGGGGSSSGGNSGGRGPSSSSNNTGAKSNTSASKSTTSATATTTRGFMSNAASYAKGALSSATTSLGNLASSVARSPVGTAVSNAWSSAKNAVASSSVGQKVAGAYNSVSSTISGAYNSAKTSVANSNMAKSLSSSWSNAKNAISNALGMSTPASTAKTGVTATASAKVGASLPANATATTPAKQSTWSSALSAIASRLGFSTPAANTTATTTTTAKPTTTTTVTAPAGFVSPQVKAQFTSLMNALSQWSPNQIGAGATTRKQNGMSSLTPDAASSAIAKKDEKRAQAVNSTFVAAEKITGVPAVIGEAIASRETHVAAPGVLNKSGMSPAPGNAGYGMMQVDQKAHPGTALGPSGVTSLGHVVTAEKIFDSGLSKVQQQHPSWSAQDDLRAAIDRYNGGLSSNTSALDRKTTGGDYGGDVLGRAQQFEKDGLGN